MKRTRLMFTLMLTLISMSQASLSAAAPQVYFSNPALQPIRETRAYKVLSTRPITDHSKILYLIDRFADTPIEILYDGHYYKSAFAANVARWFIARRYRKETGEQFINKWCNATVPGNNLIWVKFPNGDFKLSKEILFSELKQLEETLLQDKDLASKKKPEPIQVTDITPAAAAELVTKNPIDPSAASAIPPGPKDGDLTANKVESVNPASAG